MNRRSFLQGLLATVAAASLPIPKFAFGSAASFLGSRLTLLDIARRNRCKLLPIVECLSESNEILKDAQWLERK